LHYGIGSYLSAPWVPIDACGMVGYIVLLNGCEDGVKGIFRHDLWLDCFFEVGIYGI
jgi:hypothetical protein